MACILQVKAAFTRAYNKESHLTPYSTGAAPKKGRRRGGVAATDDLDELEGGYEEGGTQPEEDEEEEEDVTTDTMIKVITKICLGTMFCCWLQEIKTTRG